MVFKAIRENAGKVLIALFMSGSILGASSGAIAAGYTLDSTHSFVEFRIQHLGYSWLYGRFNTVKGNFLHDASKPEKNKINITIDAASIDSNHAERDKHLRGKDFLHVNRFPTATFKATSYSGTADKGILTGKLTLHGVTRSIDIDVTKMGEGKDPWGGYRAGFSGTVVLKLADYGMTYDLGPASTTIEMRLGIEGIRY
ncbi:MAG: YceI family protein [Pseudomonadales bacterium]|nr:YceI family protein [Pseudomonadales bacterium]